jgi:hypothetical protein
MFLETILAFLENGKSFLGVKMLLGIILTFLGASNPFLGTRDAGLRVTLLLKTS